MNVIAKIGSVVGVLVVIAIIIFLIIWGWKHFFPEVAKATGQAMVNNSLGY